MTNSSVSPIEELKAAIQSYNPFSSVAIDKVQSVWGKGFPDLLTLNAHASQKVLETVKQVQTSKGSNDKVATLVVTGDVGSGKTQLIGRLRRRVVGDGSALFVYANAGKYGDLNLLRYQFLQTLVEELARVGSQKVTQWQEVAVAMANASNPKVEKPLAATIVNNFDKAYTKALNNNHNLIKWLSAQVLKTKPDADPFILRAILWTLSESHAPYAVAWLAGTELDPETAMAMGLPTNANKTARDREAEALGTIIKILRLVSDHKPVLICFDELETGRFDEYGRTTSMVIANLVKDLHDNLELSSIGKGVVILTAMFQSTWAGSFSTASGSSVDISGGVVDRMSTATKAKPISLDPLNSQSTVDLVALWLREELYEPRNLKPHDPVYPFAESKLREIGKGKPTVREVLDWCAKNYNKIDAPPPPPIERFELALKEANDADIGDYLENNELIANALRFGFDNLIGQTLDGLTSTGQNLKQVSIESIDIVGDWLNFKVSGTENNRKFAIGIAVIQKQKSAVEIKEGLKCLTDYDKFGLTRGCLVRAKDKKIRRGTQTDTLLKQLIEKMGGEWAYLEADQIRPLINLYNVYQNCVSYNLKDTEVKQFSKERIFKNALLREILSDPSGKIDSDTIQEDPILGTKFDDDTKDDTANNDEINEIFVG